MTCAELDRGRAAGRLRAAAGARRRAALQRRADRAGGWRPAGRQRAISARTGSRDEVVPLESPTPRRLATMSQAAVAGRRPRRRRRPGPRGARRSPRNTGGSARMSRDRRRDVRRRPRPEDWAAPGRRAGAQRRDRRRPAAGRARPGAHHGHRRCGHERAGPHPARARRRRERLRGARLAHRDRRCGRSAPTVHIGHSPDAPRRRRHVRLHDRDQPQAPGVRRRPRTAASRCCAGPRRSPPRWRTGADRDRRHPRQDLDHLAARRSAAQACGARPVVRDRRQPLRDAACNAHLGTGELRDRRGRRERRLVPAHCARPRR